MQIKIEKNYDVSINGVFNSPQLKNIEEAIFKVKNQNNLSGYLKNDLLMIDIKDIRS